MSEKSVAVHNDPLFVALTRVPTVLGVPYVAFVIEIIAGAMINIMSGNPLYILAVLPIHAVFYAISSHDPGVFAEIEVWTKTSGRCLNKSFWGAASFSPVSTRKWKK